MVSSAEIERRREVHGRRGETEGSSEGRTDEICYPPRELSEEGKFTVGEG